MDRKAAPKPNKHRTRRFIEGYLRHLGVVSIRIDPADDGGQRLTIAPDIELSRSRYWFSSREDAEVMLRAVVETIQEARCTGPNSVRIVAGAEVDLLDVARRRAIPIMGPQDMQVAAGRVVARAESLMREMNQDGRLKTLNREYAVRRASGEPVGGYGLWIERKVSGILNSVANLVRIKNVT